MCSVLNYFYKCITRLVPGFCLYEAYQFSHMRPKFLCNTFLVLTPAIISTLLFFSRCPTGAVQPCMCLKIFSLLET
ncbi:hypothetical protein XELAEV_18005646mg [Xenopus laevis]|uniref:Uncharacterized protein n=1 Tax=Xenopus laevis TaxID=8355 RepID=A0A974DY13_XENLA|nr:hypothetical protein XELAEV_18005646mg [Xenopus laevis]